VSADFCLKNDLVTGGATDQDKEDKHKKAKIKLSSP